MSNTTAEIPPAQIVEVESTVESTSAPMQALVAEAADVPMTQASLAQALVAATNQQSLNLKQMSQHLYKDLRDTARMIMDQQDDIRATVDNKAKQLDTKIDMVETTLKTSIQNMTYNVVIQRTPWLGELLQFLYTYQEMEKDFPPEKRNNIMQRGGSGKKRKGSSPDRDFYLSPLLVGRAWSLTFPGRCPSMAQLRKAFAAINHEKVSSLRPDKLPLAKTSNGKYDTIRIRAGDFLDAHRAMRAMVDEDTDANGKKIKKNRFMFSASDVDEPASGKNPWRCKVDPRNMDDSEHRVWVSTDERDEDAEQTEEIVTPPQSPIQQSLEPVSPNQVAGKRLPATKRKRSSSTTAENGDDTTATETRHQKRARTEKV